MSLKDKTVLITGATGNLGTVVVRRFAETEARLAVAYRKEEALSELLDAVGGTADVEAVQCDLTSEGDVEGAFRSVHDILGGPDVLLNLAGMYAPGKRLVEERESRWDRMFDINLKTCFLACKHALAYMLEQDYGRIVNVSSKIAIDLPAGSAAYATAKAGVLTLTQCLAHELKGTDVSVAAIVPSIIDTPGTRSAMPKADFSKWVTREEIADVLVYLSGEEAGAVNGAILPMYGDL